MPEQNDLYSKGCKLLMDNLYKDRENFTIVALTGYTGTGCSVLAELMSKRFGQWPDVRTPDELVIPPVTTTDNEVLMFEGKNNNQAIGSTIFERKYTLCHNFAQANYEPFTILKYSYALLFYTLYYIISEIEKGNTVDWEEKGTDEEENKVDVEEKDAEAGENKADAEENKLGDEGQRADVVGKDKADLLKDALKKILSDKYRPSKEKKDDDYRRIRLTDVPPNDSDFSEKTEHGNLYEWEKAHDLTDFGFNDWDTLINAFVDCKDNDNNNNNDKLNKRKAAKLFFDERGPFLNFVQGFNKYLWELDPYCTDFFYHRLGFVIRATGKPLRIAREVMALKEPMGENLYRVVDLINELIKGYRKNINPKYEKKDNPQEVVENDQPGELKKKEEVEYKPCRIVIDKIRNSLEAKYLKERYSAFYLIATHEEQAVKEHLKNRIQKIYPYEEKVKANENLTALQIRKIIALDMTEREGKDFEDGKFFAQNLSQCVADAEIHISNEEGKGGECAYFYSMSEQWMKYASLIQHPGLITPSSEERCMVVAYTAKFNSGCISRQVGAVITNKFHSIRTIGWNDVPYGHVPCGLRNLPEMATGKRGGKKIEILKYLYSEYETGDIKKFKDGETFNEKVRNKYRNLHLGVPQYPLMDGYAFPYCFKSLQNEFEGEKNQVHIRSLHAEENAILQMAKYGGEALNQGIIYVTASPCELCCKKLYQIGVRKIVYIDEYPGISRENIIANGYHRPKLKQFQGAYGATYFKLYQPIITYKEELAIRQGEILKPKKAKTAEEQNDDYLKEICKELKIDLTKSNLTKEELINQLRTRLNEKAK